LKTGCGHLSVWAIKEDVTTPSQQAQELGS